MAIFNHKIVSSSFYCVPCVAYKAITAVERYLLHAVSYILQQLAEDHARYCATTVVHLYWQLHKQLSPSIAADTLECISHSLIALSDKQFADFWMHLLESDWEDGAKRNMAPDRSVVSMAYNRYRCVMNRFFPSVKWNNRKNRRMAQTPLTSPDDGFEMQRIGDLHGAYRNNGSDHSVNRDFKLGWAIEYLEQESSSLPEEMTRRMRQMMHCSIPLNLFQVTVVYAPCDASDGELGLLGSITPESLPPTPITRALQTTRMNHYTISVLDHANLALRHLERS